MHTTDRTVTREQLEREVEQLRARDAELTDFLENASVGLHWVGPDGTILWTNQAELDLLGYRREEYVGHHIAEFHVDPPVIDDILRRLSAKETLRNYEARLRCKDGSFRHVVITSNVRWEGDRFVHTRCFTRDITDRKQYEQRLLTQHRIARILATTLPLGEATHQLLQAVCEGLGWPIGLFWTWDTTACVLRCEAFWQAPGSRGEEFARRCRDVTFEPGIGLPGRIWTSRQPAWIPDLGRDDNFPRLRAAAASGFRAGFGFPIIHAEALLGVMEFFREDVRSSDQDLVQMAAVLGYQIGDYVEQQRSRAALAEREERYRVLTETALDGIIAINATSTIVFANTAVARLFGYERAELLDMDLTILLPGHAAPASETVIRRYVVAKEQRGSGRAIPVAGRHKDGHELALEVSFAEYQEGREHLFVGILRDVSDRQHWEQQLRQTAKLESLGLLAGGIAHDFNNLLTGIVGNISLAHDMLSQDHPARESLEQATLAGDRAAQLTKQLLAYAGKGRFVIQPVDMSALVREVSTLVTTSLPKTAHLQFDLAEHLPCIEADVVQLQQLAMNLIINAGEAIGTNDGTVRVTTGVQAVDEEYLAQTLGHNEIGPGKYVTLEVHDTGVGMDAVTQSRIFDPFFTTKFAGRGLGLAAALGIVRGHKGALKVYSEPGKGSTFKALFPVAAAEATFAPAPKPSITMVGVGTALVVDDEAVVRNVARSMLEHLGYKVITAENGEEAIARVRENPGLAVILLDLTMPVLGGNEALEIIKGIDPAVPVILSSGYNEMEVTKSFAGKGLAGFLQKPYTQTDLAARLHSAPSR